MLSANGEELSVKTLLIAIVTICVGVAAGWGGRRLLRRMAAPPTETADRATVSPVTPLNAETPHARDPGFVGVVLAQETVEVMAKSPGRIQQMNVRLGDHVRRDDRLVVLDSAPIRHELAMAQAGLAAAEGDAEKAEFEAREAHERLTRREPLVEGGVRAISSEELQSARYADKMAASRLKTARAAVIEKRAHVKQLEALVGETQIRAPFDGIVAARYVDE